MFLLLNFVSSVNMSHYRKCADSPFCNRNRFIENSNWTLISDSSKIQSNYYTALIKDEDFNNNLRINISVLRYGIPHVRIENVEQDKFPRYNFIKEPSLINQEFIDDIEILSYEISENKVIVSSRTTKFIINPKPFDFDIYINGSRILSLNYNHTAVFETNLDKKLYPVLNRPPRFNNQPETIRNGPTSVAFSFKFDMFDLKFSGLAHHTLNLTLNPTMDDEPIRFFNTDINSYEIGNGMSMYGAIPFLTAHNRSYSIGLYWCNPSETWVDLDEDSSRFVSETGYIEFLVVVGRHNEVTRSFADITGYPAMPQQFALGFHQCRWTYMSSEELLQISKSLDESLIPHDSLWLDLDHTDDKKFFTFKHGNYKDLRLMQYELLKSKRFLVTLVDPHLKNDHSYNIFQEALDSGYLIKDNSNNTFYGNCWPGNSSWVDFFNPEAREWWSNLFNYSKYKDSTGILFIWNDMNEPSVFDIPDATIPRDTIHFGNIEDREVHNLNGHFSVLATAEGLIKRCRGDQERPFILTRSFFAGSQKYAVMWTGDNAADWDHLRNSIPQVLSLSICQFPYAGSDVGGFFNSPDNELLCRWFQVGAWTYSFFRCHCHHLSDKREPYTLKPGWRELARDAIVERYQLFPLWYTASRLANLTGEPIVAPLYFYFDDAEIQDEEHEVIIGQSLLVAPILEPKPKGKYIKLPQGEKWYDYRTFEEFTESYKRKDISSVPVYIRGGRIIFQKQKLRKSIGQMFLDNYTMIVALDRWKEAQGELYVDDGKTFKFMEGEFLHRKFEFQNGMLCSMEHETEKGSFDPYKNVYITTIKILGMKNPPFLIQCNDNKYEGDYEHGVLTISDIELPVSEDWQINFCF